MKYQSFTWSIGALQFLAWFNIIGFIILCSIFLYTIFIEKGIMLIGAYIYIIPLTILLLLQAIVFHITAKGLLKQKKWARYTTIIVGVLMLFGFPIWTPIGILFIYGMTKGIPNEFVKITNKS